MSHIVHIYSPSTSNRLNYILNWIFIEQFKLACYELHTSRESFTAAQGIKICYSKETFSFPCITLFPEKILFEDSLQKQQLNIQRWKKTTVLFYNQPQSEVHFDLFAACFYLISRYEEYLPHKKDKHFRFSAKDSVALQYAFLQQPVVDEYLLHFGKLIEKKFDLKLPAKKFTFLPTYDIDIAWAYLYKNPLRQILSTSMDIAKLKFKNVYERLQVLLKHQKDPFDNFEWLNEIHAQYQLHPIYFLLLAKHGKYDKNNDPQHPMMQKLIVDLSKKYPLGIHPSYQSNEDKKHLQEEINLLRKTTNQPVVRSRQHYIRLNLPDTYEGLIDAGITDDYSMGYASHNGFRASTSNSFLWYNLKKDTCTHLRVHPFAFMEATSIYYQKHNRQELLAEWNRIAQNIYRTQGTMISIWHNYTLSASAKGYRDTYLSAIENIKKLATNL